MKTNRELNTEHDKKQTDKIRPKEVEYSWKPLQDVIHIWIAKAK